MTETSSPDLDKAVAQAVEIPNLVANIRKAFPGIQPMPEWFRLAREAANQLEKLHNWKTLYSGDVMSLNGEVDHFREECEEKDKEIEKLQSELDRYRDLSTDKEKYIAMLEECLAGIDEIIHKNAGWVTKRGSHERS